MGINIVPPYRLAITDRPTFEQPRGIPFEVWAASVAEVMSECPPPYGLYNNPDPWISRPDPRDPERR